MTISLYLLGDDTEITTLHDAVANPFKLGDEVFLSVDEIYPADYDRFNDAYRVKLLAENSYLTNKFRLKTIKIVEEKKFMRIKTAKAPHLTIEYYCEIIN